MSITNSPTIETTVGELVTQRPSRSRAFERLGIDYCCGGKKPLAKACADKGLDPAMVLNVLLATEDGESRPAEKDWSQASLTELADHIEQTHHAYLKRELPRLKTMVRKVAAVHGEGYPWMLEVDGVFAGFAAELESHMMKEEQMLFPLIRALESGELPANGVNGSGIDKAIAVMEHEHDDAGHALERIRKLTDGFTPPAEACNTFRATLDGLRELESDMHRHVHKENSILFPRAMAFDPHQDD
ncbi:MAG: iron-sulfur cluster repair di-iron protein [Phycisphaeraceae bacterium]